MFWLPALVLLALIAALAVGLWLSALNVQYRDVQHMIPFLLQAWMYASPVVYSIDMIPSSGPWRLIYGLNPMTGVIQGFRWALLGQPAARPVDDCLGFDGNCAPGLRAVLLPEHGAQFRGYGVGWLKDLCQTLPFVLMDLESVTGLVRRR